MLLFVCLFASFLIYSDYMQGWSDAKVNRCKLGKKPGKLVKWKFKKKKESAGTTVLV